MKCAVRDRGDDQDVDDDDREIPALEEGDDEGYEDGKTGGRCVCGVGEWGVWEMGMKKRMLWHLIEEKRRLGRSWARACMGSGMSEGRREGRSRKVRKQAM